MGFEPGQSGLRAALLPGTGGTASYSEILSGTQWDNQYQTASKCANRMSSHFLIIIFITC